jgi:hypothetical protein
MRRQERTDKGTEIVRGRASARPTWGGDLGGERNTHTQVSNARFVSVARLAGDVGGRR